MDSRELLKKSAPAFIRSHKQVEYYCDSIDLLVDSGIAIRDQDVYAIGMMALNLALIDECAESIDEDGMMMQVEGDRGLTTKTNPAVAMQKEAQTALRFYFDRFQMSPHSRGNSQLTGANARQPKSKKDTDSISSIVVQMKGK